MTDNLILLTFQNSLKPIIRNKKKNGCNVIQLQKYALFMMNEINNKMKTQQQDWP